MNVAELTTKLGEIYACVDGPPRAYFELPLVETVSVRRIPPATFRWPFRWLLPIVRRTRRVRVFPRLDGIEVLRIVYTTVQVCSRGDPDLAEPLLCEWAYVTLRALLTPELIDDHRTVLFWRRRPEISEFTSNDGAQCTALRMRLAIPGIDLSPLAKPEGDDPIWL